MSDYLRPTSLSDALNMRKDYPHYAVLAGGTDIMVGAGTRPSTPSLIDVFGLNELVGIREEQDEIRVGAATPYAIIMRDELIQRRLPMLASCVREIGAAQIQWRGTLGGNIATSSPVGDTLPVLLATDASVEVASTKGTRLIRYDTFCTGYRKTALSEDELIIAVRFPRTPNKQYWRKVGTRNAQAISKVMLAASTDIDGNTLQNCRIAIGAVADRPIRCTQAEDVLEGVTLSALNEGAVQQAVWDSIKPIDDVRSSADYRKQVAGNLAAEFVRTLNED